MFFFFLKVNYLFNLLFKTNDWFLHKTQNRAEMGETDKNCFVNHAFLIKTSLVQF